MQPWIKPVEIRSAGESHRQATWLELLVDLGFVVAIASLFPVFKDGLTAESLTQYILLFLLVFWAWNRLTWYATFYDNDDILFRASYLIAILPIIGFASAVPQVLEGHYKLAILWYLSLEVLLLILWLRVYFTASELKRNSRTFIIAYLIGAMLLTTSLFVSPETAYILWAAAFVCQILGPYIGWSLSGGDVPVHTSHILERHGLFTIILLGEGMVAVSGNLRHFYNGYWAYLLLAYAIVIFLWWLYFDCGYGFKTNLSRSIKNTFTFGYGQFFVFGFIVLTTLSLEFILHSLAEDSHASETFLSYGDLLHYSLAGFLLTLSIIQILISDLNPPSIYVPRMGGAAILILTALFTDLSSLHSLMIGAGVLFLVTCNDIYHWGIVSRNVEM